MVYEFQNKSLKCPKVYLVHKKTTLDRNSSHQLRGFLENNFKITFRMFEVPSEFTDSDSDLVVTDASYNI